jgi:hypothetical protein
VADAGATYLPAVGLSAANALAFVVGHAVLSIGVPIAIVEALARGRRTTPWLRLVGLSVTGALYLLGAVLIFRYMGRTEQFLAPVPGDRRHHATSWTQARLGQPLPARRCFSGARLPKVVAGRGSTQPGAGYSRTVNDLVMVALELVPA